MLQRFLRRLYKAYRGTPIVEGETRFLPLTREEESLP
jgi:hypothetical protein